MLLTFQDCTLGRLSPNQDILDDFLADSEAWINTLTANEASSLLLYTNTFYKDMNTGSQSDVAVHLDAALTKYCSLASTPGTQVLYRGLDSSVLRGIFSEDTVTFDSFLSTTLDPALANNFMVDGGIMLEIIAPSAAPVGSYSIKEDREREYIVPRNTTFRIIRKEENVKYLLGSEHNGEIYDFCSRQGVTIYQLVEVS